LPPTSLATLPGPLFSQLAGIGLEDAQRVAVLLEAEVDDVRALDACGRQMPLKASVFQPVPSWSCSVPAPPFSAPGCAVVAARTWSFW
jgi:hypothetical protein